jgi:hypothetical protein
MSSIFRLFLLGLVFLPYAASTGVAYAQQVPATPVEEQPEVLTRGPVHEAFAEPVGLTTDEGMVAPRRPPADVAEEPPTQRPQGSNIVWVPGYWAWDADRDDYIWVSACWRAAPPGMFWLPGYWTQAPEGWRWVSGAWSPVGTRDIQYLPEPPTLQEEQALGAPPSTDYVWVPACQYWSNGRYEVRRGYWLEQQPGWVWVPSSYIWSPHGYIFIAGHWDYAMEQRGILFAPVYFHAPLYLRPGFVYSPSIVLDIGLLEVNLFAYPRYHHYYFGDYYDEAYLRVGIYPRFEAARYHSWYDPTYEYDRWRHERSDARWEEHERHEYESRRSNAAARPPRTWHEMEEREARSPADARARPIARPLTTVAAESTSWKFKDVDDASRRQIASKARDVGDFRDERSQWESPGTSSAPHERSASEARPPSSNQGHSESVPRSPEQATSRSPEQATSRSPEQATSRSPEQATSRSPEQATSRSPEQATQRSPEQATPRTQPERVDIPKPPIQGGSMNPGPGHKSPPPRPPDEHRQSQGGNSRGRRH